MFAAGILQAGAQITVSKNDFALPGDTLYYGHDTVKVTVDPGASAGAAQTWDYSNLANQVTGRSWFLDPSASPVPAPQDITHVFIDGDASQTSFINATDTALYLIQPNPAYMFVGGEQFLGLRSLKFPLHYQDENTDSIKSVSVVPGSAIFLGTIADSVRVTISISFTSTCDGWGALKTPKATYENTLRLKNTIVSTFRFEGKKAPIPGWFNIPVSMLPLPIPARQTEVAYVWLGTGSRYFLAEENMVTDTPSKRDFFRWQTDRPLNSGLHESVRNTIDVSAWPNPSAAGINLQFTLSSASEMTVEMYDMTGRLVKSLSERCHAGSNLLRVDVAGLSPGLYQAVVSGNGRAASVKVSVK